MSQAYDKLKKQAQSLKSVPVKEEKAIEPLGETAMAQFDPALQALFQESADEGSENISGGDLPLLKVHSAGRSIGNILVSGAKPTDGYFFYRPTQEEFYDLVGHIVTISRGFRMEGMEDKEGKKEPKFNQLVGGVFLVDTDVRVFVSYVSGIKLPNLWEFGKEARKYTKNKKMPIPMYALPVHMTNETVSHKFGEGWVTKYEIIKDEQGNPEISKDVAFNQMLRDLIPEFERMFDSIITNKGLVEDGEDTDVFTKPVQGVKVTDKTIEVGEEVDTRRPDGSEDVDPDTIPF